MPTPIITFSALNEPAAAIALSNPIPDNSFLISGANLEGSKNPTSSANFFALKSPITKADILGEAVVLANPSKKSLSACLTSSAVLAKP